MCIRCLAIRQEEHCLSFKLQHTINQKSESPNNCLFLSLSLPLPASACLCLSLTPSPLSPLRARAPAAVKNGLALHLEGASTIDRNPISFSCSSV
jgi:hypothetical protein